jgi:hypothetical protein
LLHRSKILLLGLLILSFASAVAVAQDWRVENADRVVAISDVHGAYEAMVATLQQTGVIDDQLAWIGGATHLVIVGDILDRGPRSRDAMDLLMRLEGEAQAAGGFVHVLIGNHETMNMIGDMRYVSREEYQAFANEETAEQRGRWFRAYLGRQPVPRDEPALRKKFDAEFPAGYFALRDAFGADGKYGGWLLSKPIIAVINDTAFVHGGLSPLVAEYDLDGINSALQSQLTRYVRALGTLMAEEVILPTDSSYDYVDIVSDYLPGLDDSPEVLAAIDAVRDLDRFDLISSGGPLWYRANVACGGVIERHRLDASLAALGASRVVIGHTPTPMRRVLQRFEGTVIEIDTGMLSTYYRGSGNALEIIGDQVAVHNQSGGDPYVPIVHPRAVGVRPHDLTAEQLEALLESGEVVSMTEDRETGRTIVQVNDGDHAVSALFSRRRGKAFFPDVAAYRLDRLLELDMVPVTVIREVEGKDGSLQFFPAKITNESVRRENGRGSGANCPLPDQWQAMYVFDTFIYNEGRNEQRMLYNLTNWGLMLIEHEKAFSTRTGRPRYLANAPVVVSKGWQAALESLTDEVLELTFADVLDKKRLRALAARRDELLAATPPQRR